MLFNKNKLHLFYLLFCFLLLNVQCKKEITDDTYFGGKVIILGHRGMGVYYKIPGNTAESIVPAIGIGADGCEVDVQLTKDSVLILHHDLDLNSNTTCNGHAYDMTWDEIKLCKFYGFENMIFVCSLDELFAKISNISSYYFSFDCKLDQNVADFNVYLGQYIRAIKRLCDKYAMTEHVFLEGDQYFLNNVKSMGLNNKVFLAGALSQEHIDTASKYNYFGISCQMDDLIVEADVAHAKGLYVMGYAPYNYFQNMNAISKKVDIIQTDDPISILKKFKRYNYEYVIP